MAVDPVPYVVHGAKHSADVFRQGFYDLSAGAEGVSSPASMGVKQTGTPSSQVQVAPGGVLIPNTYSGGSGQSYTGRNASATLVDVPASDSTGAKSYYIIFRVQDPQFGGQAPADPLVGPYSFLECVSTSANITDPHYRLAKVTVPASTSTIQQSMIEDLRSLALPHRQPLTFARPRVLEDSATQFLTQPVSAGGEKFPGGNGDPNAFRVVVPKWATRILIDAAFMSVMYKNGTNPWGRYWIEYGDVHGGSWPKGQQYEFTTQQFAFDSPSGNNMRADWRLMSSQHMPAKLRGKEIIVAFMAGRNDPGPNDAVRMDHLSGLGMHITFVQTTLDPVTNESPQ